MTANVEEDVASAPWEIRNGECLVEGINELYEADGSGGPETKYAALFDSRPVFDGLRVSFLRMTGGPQSVRLEDALGEYLETDADAEGNAAVLEHLDRCRAYYDPWGVGHCPPWFAEAAWQ